MELAIILSIVASLCVAIAFGVLLRKLAADPHTLPATADWIEELSVEKYAPMLRLLSEDDVRFLASQPGYSWKVARQFRAQRCEIFLGYVRWLRSDFAQVCTALRILMVQSRHDRPDLATLLLRQKVLFGTSLAMIYFNLALYRLGLGGVSAEGLMSAFDTLSIELRHLVPAGSDCGA